MRNYGRRLLKLHIFGSIAEGFAIHGESDLDLILVPKVKEDWFELLKKEISDLFDLGIVLNLHLATNESYERLLKVAKAKGIKIV